MTEKLYILLTDQDELSYCVYNSDNHSIKHIEISHFEIGKLNDLFQSFDQSTFIYSGSCFTLIPSQIFDDSHTYNYLKLSHTIDDDTTILSDKISTADVFDIYSLPYAIYDVINKYKDKISIRHHSGILLQAIPAYLYQDSEAVFVNIDSSKMDILVFNGKKPLLCERFNFASSMEFMYFILNTYKQLNLNTDITPLFLSGNIGKDCQEYKLTVKHIKNIRFAENKQNIILPGEIEFHRHLNLLSAILCE